MCSYMRMFTVRHILIAWRMLRKGCYGNFNVLAFSIMGRTKTIRISVPRVDAIFSFFENGEKKIPVFQNIRIRVDSFAIVRATITLRLLERGSLGRRLSNHNSFWKQQILQLFCKRTNNIQENEGCFLRGQVGSDGFKLFNDCTVEHWILLLRLQKNLEDL